MNQIPFSEILEAQYGPFNELWAAIRTGDPEMFKDREVARQLLGAESFMNKLASERARQMGGSCEMYQILVMSAINALTGLRGYTDNEIAQDFNDCDNYDDVFADDWEEE